jgi:hypothetical protein
MQKKLQCPLKEDIILNLFDSTLGLEIYTIIIIILIVINIIFKIL